MSETSQEFKERAGGEENPNTFLTIEVAPEIGAWLVAAGHALSQPQPTTPPKTYVVTPEMVAAQIVRAAYFEDASGGDTKNKDE